MLWIWPLTTIFRFEGEAINEHFLPKACFSTLRGKSMRKHAVLMAINGSLTEINVETQRAKHTQANPNAKTLHQDQSPIRNLSSNPTQLRSPTNKKDTAIIRPPYPRGQAGTHDCRVFLAMPTVCETNFRESRPANRLLSLLLHYYHQS